MTARPDPLARTVLRTDRVPALPEGARVLTGHRRAAAALGAPHLSPGRLAARVHRAAGGSVADRLTRWRALGRAIAETQESRDPLGLRRVLAGPVRELLRAGADRLAPDAAPPGRLRDLVRVAARYRELLAEEGAIDPAEVFWAAARAAPAPVRLGVWGAPRLGPDGCAFLDAVAAPGSLVAVAPDDPAADLLAARGWRVADDAAPAGTPGERLARAFRGDGAARAGDAVAHRFASREEELRWVLARAKALLREGAAATDVVLAARDDAAVAPLAEAIAWEFGVPLRVAHAVPLRETRLGGWLDGLREAVARGLPYEETSRLLAHRLVGGWSDDAARAARELHPEGQEAWSALDGRAAALAWPREDAAGAWRERLDATLAAFGVGDEAALGGRDAAALRVLREGVAAACRPPERRRALREFLGDLDDLLALLTVRRDPVPAGDDGAVELLALPALAGARVPHLFVLGAVEGELPAAVRDDPLLDFAGRARLAAAGLPLAGADDRAREEEAAFAALLGAAAGPLALTVPAADGALPSPFLERLGLRPAPAPARPPASPEERRRRALLGGRDDDPDPLLAAARRAWRVEARRESAEPPDGHDGVTGRPLDAARRTLSATQITELGGCPFRWFVHRVLEVRELEEVEEAISPRLRGLLWHAALEGATRAAAERAPDARDAELRAAVLTELPAAFEAAEREVGVPALPAWRKAREAELRALVRAVRADDFVAPGARPVAFEARFRGVWRGLPVSGVVDRVDEGPEGIELIDYKSGTGAPRGARDAAGRGWIDVQLPLYLEAAAPLLAPGRPVAAARYLSVRSGETVRTARPGANEEALAELAARVRDHLARGAFPVEPDPRRRVCDTCDLAALCRIGPRVDRKRDAARAEVAS